MEAECEKRVGAKSGKVDVLTAQVAELTQQNENLAAQIKPCPILSSKCEDASQQEELKRVKSARDALLQQLEAAQREQAALEQRNAGMYRTPDPPPW